MSYDKDTAELLRERDRMEAAAVEADAEVTRLRAALESIAAHRVSFNATDGERGMRAMARDALAVPAATAPDDDDLATQRRRTINAALSWQYDVGGQASFEAQLDALIAAVRRGATP